jgi:hypothetical protein
MLCRQLGRWSITLIASVLTAEARAAVVQATFIGSPGTPPFFLFDTSYSNPANWSPAIVPNNGGGDSYDIYIPDGIPRLAPQLIVDTDATVSNLFGPATPHTSFSVNVIDHQFTVTDLCTSPSIHVSASAGDAALSLGQFSWSVGPTLIDGGNLALDAAQGYSATLRIKGANIVTNAGDISISGVGAHIIDENGNDGLRNLAQNLGSITLGNDFTTRGDFRNDGTLVLRNDAQATANITFTVNGNLGNYDNASHTLGGGHYTFLVVEGLSAAPTYTLRFNDADIINNGAEINVQYVRWRINDQFGADALRHLARNTPQGSITLADDGDFTTPGDFTNDGVIDVGGSRFLINGRLLNYSDHTLMGGTYRVRGPGYVSPGEIRFNDADIIHNAATIELYGPGAQIVDQYGNDALRHLASNMAGGVLRVEQRSLSVQGDFTNDGALHIAADGALAIQGSLTSSGSISVDHGSSIMSGGGGGAFTQMAQGVTLLAGSMVADSVNLLGGSLRGSGNITGNLASSAALQPEGLTIGGRLTLTSAAQTVFSVETATLPEWLLVGGPITLGGELDVADISIPVEAPDEIILIRSGTSLSGSFANVADGERLTTTDSLWSFRVEYGSGVNANQVIITDFQSVPEPGTGLVNVTLAFLLAGRRRRRR